MRIFEYDSDLLRIILLSDNESDSDSESSGSDSSDESDSVSVDRSDTPSSNQVI